MFRLAISPITVDSQKKGLEPSGFVDEVAVRLVGASRELVHGREIFGIRRRVRIAEQRCLEGRGRQCLKIAPPNLRVRIFGSNHLALLSHSNRALYRARRLRQDRLIARPTPAANRATAAMKQAQVDAVPAERLDEL